ncbi:helix-turn-helix transcriptional regulator [Pontivivens ytuae]|uniref:Helix-turn-helix transcriptional regulator n=1 Tax=Pontivivens ytuae TaxID=2789856 RepID=A0A7S9LVT0_9RHOB|nr:helix-turn-helix transcriptional regulator [Pontivivens ytuae]
MAAAEPLEEVERRRHDLRPDPIALEHCNVIGLAHPCLPARFSAPQCPHLTRSVEHRDFPRGGSGLGPATDRVRDFAMAAPATQTASFDDRPGAVTLLPPGNVFVAPEIAHVMALPLGPVRVAEVTAQSGDLISIPPGLTARLGWSRARLPVIAARARELHEEVVVLDQPPGALELARLAELQAGDAVSAAALADLVAICFSAGRTRLRRVPQKVEASSLARLCTYVDGHLDGAIRIADLAAIWGQPPEEFRRTFRSSTGYSPYAFVISRRLDRAQELLHEPERSIAEVAMMTGFSSQSHMTDTFRRVLDITPAEYRRRIVVEGMVGRTGFEPVTPAM